MDQDERAASRTKYQKIVDDLRAKIRAGGYDADGGKMPSKAALMTEYGVALNTVDRAIELLRTQGWVQTVQGVGMFACIPKDDAPSPPEDDRMTQVEARLARLEAQMEDVQANMALPQAPTSRTKKSAAS